jgi:hypothetical protein
VRELPVALQFLRAAIRFAGRIETVFGLRLHSVSTTWKDIENLNYERISFTKPFRDDEIETVVTPDPATPSAEPRVTRTNGLSDNHPSRCDA